MIEQVMDLWVTPEVKRRQEQGLIPKPLNLRQAQVIFFPDGRPPQIRLNDEVRVVPKVKLKKGVSKNVGDDVYYHEVEHFDFLELPQTEDQNCGHITVNSIGGDWHISFDARYNKQIAQSHLQKANEFFACAVFSKGKGHWCSFVDTLFSASELAAKAILITSDLKLARSKGHGSIHSKLNQSARLGNIASAQREAFNKLSGLRAPARYANGPFTLSEYEASGLLDSISQMIETAEKRISNK